MTPSNAPARELAANQPSLRSPEKEDPPGGALRAAVQLWLSRARVLAAAVLVWIGLYFVLDRGVLPPGDHRPATVLVGFGGAIAAVAMTLVLVLGAAIGAFVVPGRNPRMACLAIGLALAVWATTRGNMDAWLIASHPQAGPALGSTYWSLLAEYLLMAIALVAVLLLVEALGGASKASVQNSGVGLLARLLGSDPAARREGPLALLMTMAIGAVALMLLSGPVVGRTLRGQVYFAILVGFLVAVVITRQLFRRAPAGWFWPAPILAGMVGVIVAAIQPGRFLGADYADLNILPAMGLVRPLPIEMFGVGLVAICWGLHMSASPEGSGGQRPGAE